MDEGLIGVLLGGLVRGFESALSLTLSLKGEGTVRSAWVFLSQPAASKVVVVK